MDGDPHISDRSDLRHVLGMRVDVTSLDEAVERIVGHARRGTSRYVCVANVHMTMEAYDDPGFQAIVNGADLVVPDGKPLVWALALLGAKRARHVRGADLTVRLAQAAHAQGLPIGIYGGSEAVATRFAQRLGEIVPGLDVAYVHAPPFRPLTDAETRADLANLRASGARVVFVGLGCPKQERWMAEHHRTVSSVFVGVGAAFDFHAGTVREAPKWMQAAGLEWFYRLSREPRRLWKRYARHNPRFVLLFTQQWLRHLLVHRSPA